MKYKMGGLIDSEAWRGAHLWKIALALLCLVILGRGVASARDDLNYPDYKVVPESPKTQVGTAKAERLGSIFEAGAGPFATAHAGDWRLANEHISATFTSVEDTTTAINLVSMPLNGFRDPYSNQHIPGSLIDVTADGESLDYLRAFTQYAGVEPNGSIILYDSVKPVKNKDAAGLEFEGSPFDNNPVRVRTTYWLTPGAYAIDVETVILNLPEGEKAPQIADMGSWGMGQPLIQNIGLINGTGKREAMETEWIQTHAGNLNMGVVPTEEMKIKGSYQGPPFVTSSYYVPAPERLERKAQSAIALAIETAKKQLEAEAARTTSATLQQNGATTKTAALNPATTPTLAAKTDAKTTATVAAKPIAPPEIKPMDGVNVPIRRQVWIVKGGYGDLLQKTLEAQKTPTGTFTGQVISSTPQKQPETNTQISVMMYDPKNLKREPFPYTRIFTDKSGHYNVKLPDGFYALAVMTKTELTQVSGLNFVGLPSPIGKTKTLNLTAPLESGVRVKVLDAATSKPLDARLRIENIPPTPAYDFGMPVSAAGYRDYAYVSAKGGEIALPPGHWIIYASHGICYEIGDYDVTVQEGKLTPLTIPLKHSSPTPGWAHVELGVRTTATPGCSIDPRDIVLMCSAEGINWVVSGDYETLTDLRPVIEQAGLSGELGASRGFRTALPAHPEWGQFLIYPVAANAPDPAVVRKQWLGLKTAKEFIATLRKLYPGALIQSDLPYTENGLGYFAIKNMDPYEISYDPDPKTEVKIDAVNIFPSRRQFEFRYSRGFLINSMMRNRFYLGATSNNGNSVLGAEPGYPRLLVYLGKGVKADEKVLFEAIQARRVEVTAGPFIEFNLNDGKVQPGGISPADDNIKMRIRLTAPKWVDTTSISLDKEGETTMATTLGLTEGSNLRFPPPSEEEAANTGMFLKMFRLAKTRDTLIGISVLGQQPMRPALPSLSPVDEVVPFAFVYPIVIDSKGGKANGKYDPSPYNQKGEGG